MSNKNKINDDFLKEEASFTHFGFERITTKEKEGRVREVFDNVASYYNLMNDLMSFGLHRLWKRYAAILSDVRQGYKVLDIAAGTGDLTKAFASKGAYVLHTDINESMLRVGRDQLLNAGLSLPSIVCDAQSLPLPDASMDLVSVAFGLRNMTDKNKALSEMCRVLKQNGRVLILEFSKIAPPLQKAFDWYSFQILPRLGKMIASNENSYRYLAESIRMHPDQQTLKTMMQAQGFGHVDVHNLCAGIVAIHLGIKC